MISSAALARNSGDTVFGAAVMISPARRLSSPSPIWRRKSPSVMMPLSRPSGSTTPRQPSAFSVMTTIASAMTQSACASGRRSPLCIRSPTIFQARAELAARMQRLEVARREALAVEQRHGETIAERELHDGRGGWRESVRAGFLGLR